MKTMRLLQLFSLPAAVWAAVVPVHGSVDNLAGQQAISNEDQFFHTPKFDTSDSGHGPNFGYDLRYMKEPLNELAHRDAARLLIQSYLSKCSELSVQTWLMGGSLLGWWWGKKMMAWDYTSTVQIAEPDLHFLAAYHNATMNLYKPNPFAKGNKFLLEISPDYMNRERGDSGSTADGRWTDLSSGLYLNITAVRYSPNHPSGEGMLYTKSGYEYHDTLLYPLRETTFEGVPAKIPFQYKKMLAERYGEGSLKKTYFKGHKFDASEMQWVMQA